MKKEFVNNIKLPVVEMFYISEKFLLFFIEIIYNLKSIYIIEK